MLARVFFYFFRNGSLKSIEAHSLNEEINRMLMASSSSLFTNLSSIYCFVFVLAAAAALEWRILPYSPANFVPAHAFSPPRSLSLSPPIALLVHRTRRSIPHTHTCNFPRILSVCLHRIFTMFAHLPINIL